MFEQKENELIQLSGAEISIHKIKVGNFEINYACTGQGFPILLLHGANIGWGQWYPNIGELSKYFRVYALDFPGSGGSTKIDFTSSDLNRDFVETVKGFIDIIGIRKCHIIGHSLGAWVALNLSYQNSSLAEKMVLVGPVGFSDYMPLRYRLVSFKWFAELISKTVMRPNRENIRKFLLSVLYGKLKLEDKFVDYFYEGIVKDMITHPLMLIHCLSGLRRMDKKFIVTDYLPYINNPTLIIVGDKDPLVSLTRSGRGFSMIPDSRLEIFQNTGHVPSLEKTEKFNKIVVDFLRS